MDDWESIVTDIASSQSASQLGAKARDSLLRLGQSYGDKITQDLVGWGKRKFKQYWNTGAKKKRVNKRTERDNMARKRRAAKYRRKKYGKKRRVISKKSSGIHGGDGGGYGISKRNRRRYKRFRRRRLATKAYVDRLCGVKGTVSVLRGTNSGTISCNANEYNLGNRDIMTNTILDSYKDDVYRYNYDDTLSAMERIAPDMSTVGDTAITLHKGSYWRVHIRNNSSVDCTILSWIVTPKQDSNQTIATSVQEGHNDVLEDSFAYDSTSYMLKPWDSKETRQKWKVVAKYKHYLKPGSFVDIYQQITPCVHRFDFYDEDAFTYRKGKSLMWMYQLQGALGHDITNATTEVGLMPAQVDFMTETCVKISLKRGLLGAYNIQPSEGLDVFTNAPVLYDQHDAAEEQFGN